MNLIRQVLFALLSAALLANGTSGQERPLLIITNRTLIDNQFIFGRNAASPPTLSKRIIDPTHRGVFGLTPSDSVIKASTSIAGGIMTGSPTLTFEDSDDTITRSGGTGAGSWIADGFAVGQYIFVRGTTNNNVVRGLLTAVAADKLTLGTTPLADGMDSTVEVRGGDRFVTVEEFGLGTINDGRYANVAGLTIDGNQPVPLYPFDEESELNLSPFGATYTADGVALDGEFPTAQNLFVKNCRGIGIAHHLADGRVFDCVVHNCHVGVRLPSSDTEISRCRLFGCRDACLWIAKNSGNCQSLNNHCYGAQIACYNEGGFPFRATNDTYADAWIGYLGNLLTDQTVLTNCLFQHNTTRDVVFCAGGCHLDGCIVNVMRDVNTYHDFIGYPPDIPAYDGKVGVQIDGDRCSIRGGTVELLEYKHPEHVLSDDPSVGIWINGDHCTVETNLVDSDEIMGEDEEDPSGRTKGIRILGTRKGVKIDVRTLGFHQEDERILIIDDPENCDGLDITLRVSGIPAMDAKSIDGYIDIASGWTGSIHFIDTSTGVDTPLDPMDDY